ncbi:hypothetical protein QCA50_004718 [Cerrena zonata]|uniref:Uncharacterized protein n=1 Tax=Cerrena zonata TaxID=2478898 RepID=A0AAW0GJJ9_9APHY
MSFAEISNALHELHTLITTLPVSVPLGKPDGALSVFTRLAPDPDEGPWFPLNKAWIRTFQGLSKEDQLVQITRGEHGVLAVYKCYQHFAQLPGMDLVLLGDQIRKFLNLVGEHIVQNLSENDRNVLRERMKQLTQGNHQQQQTAGESSSGIQTNPKDGPDQTEKAANDKGTQKKKRKKTSKPVDQVSGEGSKPKKQKRAKPSSPIVITDTSDANTSESDSEKDDPSDIEEVHTRAGRERSKAEWCFAQWTPSSALKKGEPVWKWECRWCRSMRTSPHTKGCSKYADEKLPLPPSSNFLSHLKNCKSLPNNPFSQYITVLPY